MVAVGDTALQCYEAGTGDPVMLISGWPQSALAWEKLIPLLADYRVIAVEPPALGTSQPTARYDMQSIADLFRELTQEFGLPRFHLVGHDIGCWIAYAFAAKYPDTLRSVTLIEAAIPGIAPGSAYAFTPEQAKKTWHFAFNYLPDLAEDLTRGREHVILEWIFRHRAAHPNAIPRASVDEYIRLYSRPGAFAETLKYYRAIFESGAQNRVLAASKLKLPVLAIAGALWLGEAMQGAIEPLAEDFEMLSIPDCAHFPPEEKPAELAAALRKHFGRCR
ncbi:alpha/beta hydrolase [Pseudorhodoplanes sp.]|uniref:alpha/beta fold hydrolase n=1 Tax=Pseudorhodoplanes sp. TaxID=1934341 RepID=UPI002C879A5D|nr:alpha/beta hydrolase [Pseudorhodoplanes sp.]HWV52230.1 alpha/beta hydrolase [Pseudorhodoplanes sp.]